MMEVVQTRIDYDPLLMAPFTAKEAYVFAKSSDGKRPPPGHPMDFDKFGIAAVFAPLGNFERILSGFPSEQQPLLDFYTRIKVPVFLLYRNSNRLANPLAFANVFTEVTNKIGRQSHPIPEIFFMAYLRPDGKWQQQPFFIPDLAKTEDDLEYLELKQEIAKLEHQSHGQESEKVIVDMKRALYFVLTGHLMNLADE